MLDLLELSFFLEDDDDDDEFVVSGVFLKGKTGSSGWAVVGKERDPLAIVAPTKILPHSAIHNNLFRVYILGECVGPADDRLESRERTRNHLPLKTKNY